MEIGRVSWQCPHRAGRGRFGPCESISAMDNAAGRSAVSSAVPAQGWAQRRRPCASWWRWRRARCRARARTWRRCWPPETRCWKRSRLCCGLPAPCSGGKRKHERCLLVMARSLRAECRCATLWPAVASDPPEAVPPRAHDLHRRQAGAPAASPFYRGIVLHAHENLLSEQRQPSGSFCMANGNNI